MNRRVHGAAIVGLLLATAIHLDWHFARPAHHQLSLGLAWHWLLAAPAFALVAWYVIRVWPERVAMASLAVLGSAVLLGGIIEPAWEYFLGDASLEWAFGRQRTTGLLAYVGTGLVAYVAALSLFRVRLSRVS